MSPQFVANNFQPTRWHAAQDKAKFANWLIQFIASGCPTDKFPQWAYERLIQVFGFIAHYNRIGFADTYFRDAQTRLRFVNAMFAYSWPGVNPEHTYGDVEVAILDWMGHNDTLNKYQRAADLEREARERALLTTLQQKYAGIPLSPELLPKPAQLSML